MSYQSIDWWVLPLRVRVVLSQLNIFIEAMQRLTHLIKSNALLYNEQLFQCQSVIHKGSTRINNCCACSWYWSSASSMLTTKDTYLLQRSLSDFEFIFNDRTPVFIMSDDILRVFAARFVINDISVESFESEAAVKIYVFLISGFF